MKKKLITTCFIVLALLVVSFFIFNKYKLNFFSSQTKLIIKNKTVSSLNSQLATSSSTISIHPTLAELNMVVIDKSDWQTYKNKQYGFEISAPKDWQFILNSPSGSMEGYGALEIRPSGNDDCNDQFFAPLDVRVREDNNNLSLYDWMIKTYSIGTSESEIGIKNLIRINIPTSDEAMATYINFGPGTVIYSYDIKKGGKIFTFNSEDSCIDIKDEDAMMKAIVETIRFTK
jgi:hypothetical protein